MGSDLHMNPPRKHYRGKWEDDILIIEMMDEGTGKGWEVIWSGDEDEVEKNRRILPIVPPLRPDSREYITRRNNEVLASYHAAGTQAAFKILGDLAPATDEEFTTTQRAMIQAYAQAFPGMYKIRRMV